MYLLPGAGEKYCFIGSQICKEVYISFMVLRGKEFSHLRVYTHGHEACSFLSRKILPFKVTLYFFYPFVSDYITTDILVKVAKFKLLLSADVHIVFSAHTHNEHFSLPSPSNSQRSGLLWPFKCLNQNSWQERNARNFARTTVAHLTRPT